MERWGGLFLVAGLYPLVRAWRGLAGTTLRHALVWAGLAWLAWCAVWLTGAGREGRYYALCLAACAGVAVLGARRPGVGAWNLVVVGLLAGLSRPFLPGLGELRLEPAHLVILGAALGVGVANYLPTRLGLPALAFAAWCAVEIAQLAGAIEIPAGVMPLTLSVVPWLALAVSRRADDDWLAFRDAYGFLWAQRAREQFIRAAANAGLRAELRWGGLHGEDELRARELLRAVLRRFRGSGPEQE